MVDDHELELEPDLDDEPVLELLLLVAALLMAAIVSGVIVGLLWWLL